MQKKESKHTPRQRKPLRGQLSLPLFGNRGSTRCQYEEAFRACRVLWRKHQELPMPKKLAAIYDLDEAVVRAAMRSFLAAI